MMPRQTTGGVRMPKYRVMRWRKNDPTHNLYKAVRDYIISKNGDVLVIGGIQIQKWPTDPAFTYQVAVKCTGRKPTFEPKEQANDPRE